MPHVMLNKSMSIAVLGWQAAGVASLRPDRDHSLQPLPLPGNSFDAAAPVTAVRLLRRLSRVARHAARPPRADACRRATLALPGTTKTEKSLTWSLHENRDDCGDRLVGETRPQCRKVLSIDAKALPDFLCLFEGVMERSGSCSDRMLSGKLPVALGGDDDGGAAAHDVPGQPRRSTRAAPSPTVNRDFGWESKARPSCSSDDNKRGLVSGTPPREGTAS